MSARIDHCSRISGIFVSAPAEEIPRNYNGLRWKLTHGLRWDRPGDLGPRKD